MGRVALDSPKIESKMEGQNGSYLDYMLKKHRKGKTYKEYKDISDTELVLQFEKCEACGTAFVKNVVVAVNDEKSRYKVGDRIYNKICCKRIYCQDCGSKGGAIEKQRKKRMRGILRRKMPINEMAMQALVFTVPEKYRRLLLSRSRINEHIRLVHRIIKVVFDNPLCFSSYHAFGDKSPGEFHPHVNMVIVKKRKEKLMIPPEKLEQVKELYREGLSLLVGENVEVVDVNARFYNTDKKVNHLIKYLCRPVPSYDDVMSMSRFMQKMFVCEMRGFQYIRYSKNWGSIVAELETEGSTWACRGVECEISIVKYDEVQLFKKNEVREVADGVYHCRSGGFG